MPEEHHEKHKLKVVIRNGSSRALHFSWVEPDGGRVGGRQGPVQPLERWYPEL